MKIHIRLSIVILISLLLFSCGALVCFADFGGFSGNNDYGGGSDYSYSSGSSGLSDLGFLFYFIDDPIVIVILIVVFIVVKILRSKSSGGSKNRGGAHIKGAEQISQARLRPISEFRTLDPKFSEEAFRENVANMYVEFQNRWSQKNLEPLRADMTDAFFNQMNRQLQQLIAQNQTNVIENIVVLGVDLRGFMQDDVNDTIVATVRSRLNECYIDDRTGSIVRGDRTVERFMTYEWTMIRKKGVLTEVADKQVTLNCPNCGAALNVNHSAQCEFCGSVITNAEYTWVLSSIKGISQQSS